MGRAVMWGRRLVTRRRGDETDQGGGGHGRSIKRIIVVGALLLATSCAGDGGGSGLLSGEQGSQLDVTPSTGLSSVGPADGPFVPASLDFTLTNTGTTSLDWTASANQPWIVVSSTGGTLAAAAQTTLTLGK